MSPRFGLLAGLVLAGVLVPRAAAACSCMNPIAPCDAFGARVVFVGTVESVREVGQRIDMRVRVTRAVKGVKAGTVVIVDSDVSSCGVRLAAGRRYLIFSHGTADRVSIHACMLPVQLLPGEPDPEFLPVRGRVYGRVFRFDAARAVGPEPFDPVPGARLWIDLPAGRAAATSDAWGRFTFSDVPPGTYRIGVDAGPGLTARHSPRLDVRAGPRCSTAYVALEATGPPARNQ